MKTKTGENTVKLKFVLMQIFYWCGVASFFAFMVALLRHKGMNASFIGVIMASYRLSSIFGQIFWGNLCDRLQTNKKVFMLTNSLSVVASSLIYLSSTNWQTFFACIMLGFCLTPSYTNMDTWLLKYFEGKTAVFGQARAAGSLSFGIFTFFYGNLIAQLGFGVMPYFQFLFLGLCLLDAAITPETHNSAIVKKAKLPRPAINDIKELLSHKEFMFLLIILLFDGFAVTSVGQMMTLVWESLEAPVSYIGYYLFASTASQVPVLLTMSKLSSVSPAKRLATAVVLDFFMFIFIYIAKNPMTVIIGAVFSGVAYGLLISSMREVIVKSAPQRLATTAQGIGDAVFASLAGMIGAIVSGIVIDSLGVKNLVLMCALIQCIPLVIVFIRLRKYKEHAN